MKFLKYNIGIIVTAIFMAAMAYKEFMNPRYGKENVPKIYLGISILLVILLVSIYLQYFHKKRN
ncbi:hypothetical protein [Dyadobacter sp. 32]|uniref:hypothetical protein n=1 Tax=Dyadobacter sp. 32 TaxID=538966 RepID=UPI0011EE74BF